MKKALFVFMALLVPFLSHATSDSIFINADTKPPETVIKYTCNGVNGSSTVLGSVTECANWAKTGWVATRSLTGGAGSIRNPQVVISGNSYSMVYDYCQNTNNDTGGCYTLISGTTSGLGTAYELPPELGCPNQQYLDYTFGVDTDSDGSVDTCANPNTIPLFDTCNINDSLNVQVTDTNACYTKSDGSQCSVSGVDVGGGNQVYMGSEGNCYTDPQPDVTGNNTLGNTPINEQCVNNGGLLTCPEDPANVCGDSGSNYGGGSVNNCQSGCGYVNDAFVCYDTDIDGDGLPDYNDPDIDGDGIPNGDDLDSDGDGFDDPINSGNGVGSGSGGSTIDLSPVVSELQKLNKNFDLKIVDAFNKDGKLEQLNTDRQTELTDFFAQDSSSLGYQDTLNLANSNALITTLPTEQCTNYSIPVGMFGDFKLDTCALSTKVQPLLTWFFGLLTAWYIFFTINRTLSEGF